jgi:hypothetical protein
VVPAPLKQHQGEPATTTDVGEWVDTHNAIASEWSLHTEAMVGAEQLVQSALDTLEDQLLDEQVSMVDSIREAFATYREHAIWRSNAAVALDTAATKVLRNKGLIQ